MPGFVYPAPRYLDWTRGVRGITDTVITFQSQRPIPQGPAIASLNDHSDWERLTVVDGTAIVAGQSALSANNGPDNRQDNECRHRQAPGNHFAFNPPPGGEHNARSPTTVELFLLL